MLKIISDENIIFGKKAFKTLGSVELYHGRLLSKSKIQNADALFVRSITKVNEELLGGTNIRFVGSATAGIDHVDTEYLKKAGIHFASAPGSNANSVAEYVITALLNLAAKKSFTLEGLKIGIIGVGNVGTKVWKKAKALGLIPVLNDPPRAEESGDPVFRPLEELLECDVITCHTPLTKTGKYPTYHLLDENFLKKMKKNSILFNTARGGVVEEGPLKSLIKDKKFKGVVLDVWENEPDFDRELLSLVNLGTPHIAGYSYDGKVKGTEMIYKAACKFFNIQPLWNSEKSKEKPIQQEIILSFSEKTQEEILNDAARFCYDIIRDSQNLKQTINLNDKERLATFDQLRKEYPRRWEFTNFHIIPGVNSRNLIQKAKDLGFKIKP